MRSCSFFLTSKLPRFQKSSEIGKLKKAGIDLHDKTLKIGGSKQDVYKDPNGNLYAKPKGGSGPGDPLGINIHNL